MAEYKSLSKEDKIYNLELTKKNLEDKIQNLTVQLMGVERKLAKLKKTEPETT